MEYVVSMQVVRAGVEVVGCWSGGVAPGIDMSLNQGGVEGDEEAFRPGEEGALGFAEFGGVEELAAFAAEVVGGEGERGVDGSGAEVIDLHVAGHGEDVERSAELAHGLIQEGGDDAAMEEAGGTFIGARKLDRCGGLGVGGIDGVDLEVQMEALWVVRSAGEAVVGLLIDGGGMGARGFVFRLGGHTAMIDARQG
jgi:hypothetical protein